MKMFVSDYHCRVHMAVPLHDGITKKRQEWNAAMSVEDDLAALGKEGGGGIVMTRVAYSFLNPAYLRWEVTTL